MIHPPIRTTAAVSSSVILAMMVMPVQEVTPLVTIACVLVSTLSSDARTQQRAITTLMQKNQMIHVFIPVMRATMDSATPSMTCIRAIVRARVLWYRRDLRESRLRNMLHPNTERLTAYTQRSIRQPMSLLQSTERSAKRKMHR